MKKIALSLKTPITFDEAKNIKANVRHYITHGGSDKIDTLIIYDTDTLEVRACLMQIGVYVNEDDPL